ncbi:MAG: type II toxin-antitoxin system HicA family toxin [Rudaea sp.]
MNAKRKLLDAIRINPKQVRFADACKAAQFIGFEFKGGAGSHRTFVYPGETAFLNFQNRKGFVVPYQARQLIGMIDKYFADE